MSLRLYMDHHISRAITEGLRARGIDVLTAQEDSTHKYSDSALLDRAGKLERILFTRDRDFLRETTFRQRNSIEFIGVIYAHQLRVTIRQCIDDLETICSASTIAELSNTITFLPL